MKYRSQKSIFRNTLLITAGLASLLASHYLSCQRGKEEGFQEGYEKGREERIEDIELESASYYLPNYQKQGQAVRPVFKVRFSYDNRKREIYFKDDEMQERKNATEVRFENPIETSEEIVWLLNCNGLCSTEIKK